MITLGGSCPWRIGVPDPDIGDPPPMALKRSGATIACPGFNELIEPDWGCKAGLELAAFKAPPSFGGSGLFRESFSAVVEEDGVITGDCAASLDELDGDDVPSLASLFLDFDDLLGSFARESCSC